MRKCRTDGNQKQIVEGLRKLGCTVLHTHTLKKCFDILVGYRGENYAFEIKDPDKPPSKRRLTNGELGFFHSWRGQVDKVETIEQIIKIMKE